MDRAFLRAVTIGWPTAALLQESARGVVTTGIVGLILAWAWFRSGRNLWALIIAHAIMDSYSIAMLYFGLYA